MQYFLIDKRSSELQLNVECTFGGSSFVLWIFEKHISMPIGYTKLFVYSFTEMTRSLVEHWNVYERSDRTINPE